LSRDEDYELWLAMNEDFEQAQVTEVAPVEAVVPAEFAPIFEQSVDQEELDAAEPVAPTLEFELSPSLIREPQTNTIVIQPVDPLAAGSIITDAGEIVLTGSIELPPITGGIEIVSMPDENKADANLADDFADNYVSSIAPVRASGVMNSRARESVLPIKNRRGESQAVLLGVTSILMVTVGALLIAAFWLGVLKF
jgi:hypothetical protein